MDENQDLTIGLDGTMKEGSTPVKVDVKADVNTEKVEAKDPEINIISPPPAEGPKILVKAPQPEVKQNVLEINSQEREDALDSVQPAPSETNEVVQAPVTADDNPKPVEAVEPAEKKTDLNTVEMQTRDDPKKKASKVKSNAHDRNNRKLAAFVTIFVALALAGAAVYVYISTQNNAEKSVTNISSVYPQS